MNEPNKVTEQRTGQERERRLGLLVFGDDGTVVEFSLRVVEDDSMTSGSDLRESP